MYTDGELVACGGVTQRRRYIIITHDIGLVSYLQSQPEKWLVLVRLPPVPRTYQHPNTAQEDHWALSLYTSCYSCSAHNATHVTARSHRPQEDIVLVGTCAQIVAIFCVR